MRKHWPLEKPLEKDGAVMSEILYWAHEVKGLTTKQRVVLTCLANMANRSGGDCEAKIEKLTDRTGLSRPSIFRTLGELEELGLLKRQAQFRNDGSQRNNRYILPTATVCAELRREASHTETGVVQERDGGSLTERHQEPPTINRPLKPLIDRATRLPDDWVPEPLDSEFRTKHCITTKYMDDQLERFRDYWKAQPGAKGRKLDWQATWRNWLRNSRNFKFSKPNRHQADMEWLADYVKGDDNEQA